MIARTSSTSAAVRTKRQRDEVDGQVQRAAQVLDVLLGHAPGRDTATPGRLMPLLLLTVPPTDDPRDDVGAARPRSRASAHLAVVDEDRVAGARRRRAGPCTSCEQISAVARHVARW